MTYEQIYKVIELYNQYKGMLNDDGTLANEAQIAAWIHPSVEEDIDEEKLDEFAINYAKTTLSNSFDISSVETQCCISDFKAGYRYCEVIKND